MNELELLIEKAEREGLIYLNDIVDYVKNIGIGIQSKSIIKTRIYNILKDKDKGRPSLADTISSIIE